jgi:outer membrane protein assembly factor BamE (lipoprotein component of BamABCDE complex)
MESRLFLPFVLILAGIGCSTTFGKKLDAEMLAQLQDGSTTIAQVTAIMGKPESITTDSQKHTTAYTYHFSAVDYYGRTMEGYSFVFSPEGVLVKKKIMKMVTEKH